jgi:predicted DNA-binding transcriptional regulator YafY
MVLQKMGIHFAFMESSFSFSSRWAPPPPEAVFRVALEGCLKQRRLSFNYQSPVREEKNLRKIDPYHLFNYMGTWHLIGYCHLRETIRDFALGRITEAKFLDETFKIPSDSDVKDYFRSSFGIYKGGPRREVTLRFSPLKSRWIKDQVWHKDQKVKFLKDGSLELTFPVADFSEIKMEILKHGADVEVIKPKSLRDLIKAEAKKNHANLLATFFVWCDLVGGPARNCI